MPTYEYGCPKCGTFEVMQKITEEALKQCPTCGEPVKRLLSATPFHLKGSGWYKTDYASSSSSASSTNSNGASRASSTGEKKESSSSGEASSGSGGSDKGESSPPAKSGGSSGAESSTDA